MVFDRNGKFIRKIGSIGRGPGEYVHYFNFTVDENSESVYVILIYFNKKADVKLASAFNILMQRIINILDSVLIYQD
jgi:hypothetical protein